VRADHRVPLDDRPGPTPGAGLAADGEFFQRSTAIFNHRLAPVFFADHQAATQMVEADHRPVALHFQPPEQRPGTDHRLAVIPGQCPPRQPLADIGLVPGMDVVGIADIDGDSHAGGGDGRQTVALGLTQHAPTVKQRGVLRRVAPGRQLHLVKGQVTRLKIPGPVGHERLLLLDIQPGGLGPVGVALALVPDRPGDAIGDQGLDHAVVQRDTARPGDALAEREFRPRRRTGHHAAPVGGPAGLARPRLDGRQGLFQIRIILFQRVAHRPGIRCQGWRFQ